MELWRLKETQKSIYVFIIKEETLSKKEEEGRKKKGEEKPSQEGGEVDIKPKD